MRQTLVLTMALIAGLALAGCEKEDSSEEQKNRNNMEQTNDLTKEQIVGVWRSGDYWVSFDGKENKPVEGEPIQFSTGHIPYYYDGINKAVLRKGEDSYADGGRYTIKGNTITVYHERGGDTKYVVTDVDDTSISFIITIPNPEGDEYTDSMSFIKTSDVSASE